MEAALRSMLQTTFGEYVDGLDKAQGASFPLVLKDLKLKAKKIQEEMDDGDGNLPFDITGGKVGSITVSPGWMGNVEVVASNIVLNFAFAPMKAMNKAMNRKSDEDEEDNEPVPQQQIQGRSMQQMQAQCSPPPAPAAPVPPRYCTRHGTSEQRVKVEPRMVECGSCRTTVQTNYSEFTLCPGCSDREQRCMLCGCSAPNAGNYMPATTVTVQPPSEPAPTSNGVAREPSVSHRGHESLGFNGPSKCSHSSVPPPPPAVVPPRTPSNVRADWDWVGAQGAAPPPPPPPVQAPNGRSSVSGGSRQMPLAAPSPQSSSRASPRPNPMSSHREVNMPTRASPRPNPMSSHREVNMPLAMQSSRTPQEQSAADHVNSLMGYFQNLQVPSLDISGWARHSCGNADAMRSLQSNSEVGMSAHPWRGGA